MQTVQSQSYKNLVQAEICHVNTQKYKNQFSLAKKKTLYKKIIPEKTSVIVYVFFDWHFIGFSQETLFSIKLQCNTV